MTVQLLGVKGSGSLIVEAALIVANVPYTFVETNYEVPADLERLLKINPTGQIPTMILSDGSILTESAAMINYIHLISPSTKLIPTDLNQNVHYWRWICFIIGSIYPTFNYGDEPSKWTNTESASLLRESTDAWRKKLWLQMEKAAGHESFLGEFSGIDIYIAVMSSWRPRNKWFRENCPKLWLIVETVYKKPELAKVLLELKTRFSDE